jgi:hypothetical protein
MNNKITTLQIAVSGEAEDFYVFEGWHDDEALKPSIQLWCNQNGLNYEDFDQSWYMMMNHTTFDKLV